MDGKFYPQHYTDVAIPAMSKISYAFGGKHFLATHLYIGDDCALRTASGMILEPAGHALVNDQIYKVYIALAMYYYVPTEVCGYDLDAEVDAANVEFGGES